MPYELKMHRMVGDRYVEIIGEGVILEDKKKSDFIEAIEQKTRNFLNEYLKDSKIMTSDLEICKIVLGSGIHKYEVEIVYIEAGHYDIIVRYRIDKEMYDGIDFNEK